MDLPADETLPLEDLSSLRLVLAIQDRYAALAAFGLLLAACTSGPPKPNVDYKQDYDFSQVVI